MTVLVMKSSQSRDVNDKRTFEKNKETFKVVCSQVPLDLLLSMMRTRRGVGGRGTASIIFPTYFSL